MIDDRLEPAGIECLKFTPRPSGVLVGFGDFRLVRCRLVLVDCPAFTSGDRRWVALPGKPQIGADRCARVDDRGKVQYAPVVAFDDKDVLRRFSDAAVAALIAFDPDAFDEAGP